MLKLTIIQDMALKVTHVIGKQIITASLQPRIGDHEDFIVRIQGPDPKTDYSVPLSITGTILAIWDNPSPVKTAESLASAIFKVIGTASGPPKEGFWFDSYNSGDTLSETKGVIANKGAIPFIKNWSGYWVGVKQLGASTNGKMKKVDMFFSGKFGIPFFKSLEDITEESRIVDDLNSSPSDHAGYIYRICIISGLIDHIMLAPKIKEEHMCSVCGIRHKQSLGSVQNLRLWLEEKVGKQKAGELIQTFSMIRKIRKQYPIHDDYETISESRNIRKDIDTANEYFKIIKGDYARNAGVITTSFEKALSEIMKELENVKR